MSEYIDRCKLIEEGWHLQKTVFQDYSVHIERASLLDIPTADVRPVVLCRDCKRYGGRPWENNESGICARTDVGVGEFDFCSYGEKKEES